MNPAVIGAFIPIVAITLGIAIGALAIWSEHKRKLELIDRLHRERGKTIVMVTHDPRAAAHGTRRMVLDKGRFLDEVPVR